MSDRIKKLEDINDSVFRSGRCATHNRGHIECLEAGGVLHTIGVILVRTE